MQLKSFRLPAIALFLPAALAVRVSFNEFYDNASQDIEALACADGDHGFEPLGYKTLGSLPGFPNVGGAAVVAGFNSPNCGSCWQLTYNGTSINVLAVDYASEGFNISLEALDELTKGQGILLEVIEAEVQEVQRTECGL
ncbi:immunomodulatory protein [Cubamyces lactineus]|nr:immunomodulatory protein [Cubamyces lactineus]